MMLADYSLIKKANAAMNLANVLSIEHSSSYFKTIMVAFVFDEINSNKRNNIVEYFFFLLHKKFLTSRKEILIYYEMLDKLIANGIIQKDKSFLYVDGRNVERKATKSKIQIIERVLQVSDADFARLFVQYV